VEGRKGEKGRGPITFLKEAPGGKEKNGLPTPPPYIRRGRGGVAKKRM